MMMMPLAKLLSHDNTVGITNLQNRLLRVPGRLDGSIICRKSGECCRRRILHRLFYLGLSPSVTLLTVCAGYFFGL